MSSAHILWCLIWSLCTVATWRTKDSNIMLIPAIGMLIWFLAK